MKKIYIVPATRIAPFGMDAILHSISNNTINGASSNGGSNADNSDGSFSTGEGSMTPDGFAKDRGFYSGFGDEY